MQGEKTGFHQLRPPGTSGYGIPRVHKQLRQKKKKEIITMKKLLALILSLLVVLGCFCTESLAASSDFVIKNGILTKYTGNGGDIVIPEGVVEVAEEVFAHQVIHSLTLPSTLKIIGKHAFFCVHGYLKTVTVPASVVKIGEGAFRNNHFLEEILVAPGNKKFKSVDGVLLSADGKQLLGYPSGKPVKSYTVPKTVQTITPLSLSNTHLHTVIIPSSVKTIEREAFYRSWDLQELTIPATVKTFNDSAVMYCDTLKKLVISSLKTEVVDDGGFFYVDKLTIYAPADHPVKKLAKAYKVPFKALKQEASALTGIKLNKTKATLTRTAAAKSPTLQLKATLQPADTAKQELKWASSDKSIATVDKNGKVTALKAGKVTITCKAADNKEIKATCTVTVEDRTVSSITLSKKKVTLKKGKTLNLKIKEIKPLDALNQKVKWTTSNKKVATVDKNGKVTAVGKGTCVITCTAKGNSKTKVEIKITVK